MNPSEKILARIDALGKISEEAHQLTRTFASPAMRQANDLVASWMREAGMSVHEDAIGNLIARYEGKTDGGKTLIIGSHLDTVRNAGKFDGPLGVILAIACVEQLHAAGERLPFSIEVVGFCDEEGVRFQTTYLGSRALAGLITSEELARTDANGITIAEALRSFGASPEHISRAQRDPANLIGYIEAHIEQGPVLQDRNIAVGVVTAIAGQSRLKLRLIGKAGHAGTTPMHLRRDALCAAAEIISAVETHGRGIYGLVATVGSIQNSPNASNVIPAEVTLTLDVRHQTDTIRNDACYALRKEAEEISKRRGITMEWHVVQETASVPCSPQMTAMLKMAVRKHEREIVELASGAGHDAAIMARITAAAMLFIRCKDGISHHPDESVSATDVDAAFDVLNDFLHTLATQHA